MASRPDPLSRRREPPVQAKLQEATEVARIASLHSAAMSMSAPGLEGLDELAGHEPQGRRCRVVLLDGDRAAVQAGAADAADAADARGEPRPAGQDVPDDQHDA